MPSKRPMRPRRNACSRCSSSHFEAQLNGRTIALWGLGLQAEYRRHARGAEPDPARAVVVCRRAGACLRSRGPRRGAPHLWQCARTCSCAIRSTQALEGADALVVVTEWKAFRSPDLARIRELLRDPVIFDGRNIFDPLAIESAGLAYYGIGRGRSDRSVRSGDADGTVPSRQPSLTSPTSSDPPDWRILLRTQIHRWKRNVLWSPASPARMGPILPSCCCAKGYEVHGLKRRASSFNTERIDHLYQRTR